MAEPDLKWVSEPFWRDKLQQAWQEYEQEPQFHKLMRYEHLVDEVSISLGIVSKSELSSRLGDDQAPSFDVPMMDCMRFKRVLNFLYTT